MEVVEILYFEVMFLYHVDCQISEIVNCSKLLMYFSFIPNINLTEVYKIQKLMM